MKALLCNVGSTDKIIRILLGLAILIPLFAMQSWWWMLGLIPIITGIMYFCPLYALLGINTCKVPKKWWK